MLLKYSEKAKNLKIPSEDERRKTPERRRGEARGDAVAFFHYEDLEAMTQEYYQEYYQKNQR